MEIEGLESQVNYLFQEPISLEETGVEPFTTKESQGIDPLVQEENRLRAQRKSTLLKKCVFLEKKILDNSYSFYHDMAFQKMVEHIAPETPELAKEYANKIGYQPTRAKALIEISKWEKDSIARETLTHARWALEEFEFFHPEIVLEIYEEQKRREFPEHAQTIKTLYERLDRKAAEGSLNALVELASIEVVYQKEGLLTTLLCAYEKAKELRNEYEDLELRTVLISLMEYAGRASLPLAGEKLLGLLREEVKNGIEKNQEHQHYPGQWALYAWKDLILLEGKYPIYEKALKEDFDNFIQTIQLLKEKYPENHSDYDFSLFLLLMDLATVNMPLAKEVHAHIKDTNWNFQGQARLAMLEPQAFDALEKRFYKDYTFSGYFALILFRVAAETQSLSRALPFLALAKKEAETLPEERKIWAYQSILDTEVEYSLEGRHETLEKLYALPVDTSHALLSVIDAEFSL